MKTILMKCCKRFDNSCYHHQCNVNPYRIGNFVYCIHSYRMLPQKIGLLNVKSCKWVFVFFLRMFQDKCNRDCNRDYF